MHRKFFEIFLLTMMLALCAGACAAVVHNAHTRRDALLTDTAAKEKAIADIDQSTVRAAEVKTRIAALQTTIDTISLRLPKQEEIDPLLAHFSRTAAAKALTVETMHKLAPIASADYVEQPVELSLAGDFRDFYSFLLAFEKQPSLIRITRLSLKKSTAHDGQANATIVFSLFCKPADARAMESTTRPALAELETRP